MNRASGIGGSRSGATPKNPATWKPNTRAIVRATLKRDADAAVAALAKHFMTTMHLVELATPPAT